MHAASGRFPRYSRVTPICEVQPGKNIRAAEECYLVVVEVGPDRPSEQASIHPESSAWTVLWIEELKASGELTTNQGTGICPALPYPGPGRILFRLVCLK